MKPALAICIPHRGTVGLGLNDQITFVSKEMPSYGFADSLAGMMHWLGTDGFDRLAILSGTASVGAFKARNGIMSAMELAEKQTGYRFDYTLWLDTDMRFPPGTAQGLISHDKDIVGATYRRRSPPYEMLGRPKTGSNGLAEVGKLYPADMLPTGLLMVKRHVYDKMIKPIWRVRFIDGKEDPIGEDILFCQNAVALGYEIWLDTALTQMVRHIGEMEFEAEVEQAPSRIIQPNRPALLHA